MCVFDNRIETIEVDWERESTIRGTDFEDMSVLNKSRYYRL